jgi:hypothetical protein
MLVHISDWVLQEILKLQAVEEWRLWNYTKVDEQLDKFRSHVSDLAMWAIMAEIHKLQNNRLPYLKPWR